MKKLHLLLCAIVAILASCTPSKEEKAEKIVAETVKDYLYHPDSYEAIATRVDSMFIDVTTIESIMETSDEIKDLISNSYIINYCVPKTGQRELFFYNNTNNMPTVCHNL